MSWLARLSGIDPAREDVYCGKKDVSVVSRRGCWRCCCRRVDPSEHLLTSLGRIETIFFTVSRKEQVHAITFLKKVEVLRGGDYPVVADRLHTLITNLFCIACIRHTLILDTFVQDVALCSMVDEELVARYFVECCTQNNLININEMLSNPATRAKILIKDIMQVFGDAVEEHRRDIIPLLLRDRALRQELTMDFIGTFIVEYLYFDGIGDFEVLASILEYTDLKEKINSTALGYLLSAALQRRQWDMARTIIRDAGLRERIPYDEILKSMIGVENIDLQCELLLILPMDVFMQVCVMKGARWITACSEAQIEEVQRIAIRAKLARVALIQGVFETGCTEGLSLEDRLERVLHKVGLGRLEKGQTVLADRKFIIIGREEGRFPEVLFLKGELERGGGGSISSVFSVSKKIFYALKTAKPLSSISTKGIYNEHAVLHEIHKDGMKEGIQLPPDHFVSYEVAGRTIVGVIGHKYACDFLKYTVSSEMEAQIIAKQITQGLLTMHSAGRRHGDIKPENIFVDIELGRYDLADMGGSFTFETLRKMFDEFSLRSFIDSGGVNAIMRNLMDFHTRIHMHPSVDSEMKDAIIRVDKERFILLEQQRDVYALAQTLLKRVPWSYFTGPQQGMLEKVLAFGAERPIAAELAGVFE
jgi:hypothetical protein